ncbi:MAG: DNA-processing protein DprA [Acidobacteriota bacterium]
MPRDSKTTRDSQTTRDPKTTRDLLIALSSSSRIGRETLCRLAAAPETWCHMATSESLEAAAGAQRVSVEQLRRALSIRPRAERLAATARQRARNVGARIICRGDADYPTRLLDLALPPPVLTVRGRLPERPAVAIVGSRAMSRYGKQAAHHFANGLAAAGVTVISGFARGVDTVAHRAALAAGGETVAVLGCGIDIDYPSGSTKLAAEIEGHGAVVSEFPLGAEPRSWHFPIRNRVIAALALGTLVIEATIKSGSLITAHETLELGRDVYAVPGRIFDPRSAGTNGLIADGALVARRPQDILECLSLGVQQELFTPAPKSAADPRPTVPTASLPDPPTVQHPAQLSAPSSKDLAPPPSGDAGKILATLTCEQGRTVEEIASQAAQPVDAVLGALLELELAGWARRAPGPVYLRVDL